MDCEIKRFLALNEEFNDILKSWNLENDVGSCFNERKQAKPPLPYFAQKIEERPLYLLGSAVTNFTGLDLEKIAFELRKMGKEVYCEDLLEENLDARLF